MQIRSSFFTALLILPLAFCMILLPGCATSPVAVVASPVEQTKYDNALGIELASQLESKLKFRKDKEVEIYLRKLAQTLTQASSELSAAGIGVLVVNNSKTKWSNYSLPGNRIYLSDGLLRGLDYESEIAAAIAFELGHLLKRSALARYAQLITKPDGCFPVPIKVMGPAGIFDFSEEQNLKACDAAVEILYKSGYDPRGMVALWLQFQKNSPRSPFEPELLAKLMDRTRRAVSVYAPLRNPVVRSEAFLAIQKRIHNL